MKNSEKQELKKKLKRLVKYLVPNVVRGRLIKLKAIVHDR